MGRSLHDLRGHVFGSWVVLERGPDLRYSYWSEVRWWCMCVKCREEFLVFATNLRSGASRGCLPCRCNPLRRKGNRNGRG